MRSTRYLQGLVLTAFLLAPPAVADSLSTTSELIEDNTAIRVTLTGPPEARVTDFILIHPEGQEIAAKEVERTTLVRETARRGGGGGVSTGVGVGVGSGGRVGTGVGIGINLGTLFSDDDDDAVPAQEETTTSGRIVIPQPIHYLQLWQDYRLEVHFEDSTGAHVLTVATPRPQRGG